MNVDLENYFINFIPLKKNLIPFELYDFNNLQILDNFNWYYLSNVNNISIEFYEKYIRKFMAIEIHYYIILSLQLNSSRNILQHFK